MAVWLVILLWVLSALLVLMGIVGTVLPALPGPVLIFVGLLLGAWAGGFEHVSWGILIVLGVLTALAYAVDLGATAVGARRLGASPRAVIGAAVGTIVGLFFGLPGVLLGPFVGAVIGEYTVRRDLEHAGRAGFGTWLGIVIGAAAKLALVFCMLGIFAAAHLF